MPSNSPHDPMILRVDLVGSHGRWRRPCLQTTHDAMKVPERVTNRPVAVETQRQVDVRAADLEKFPAYQHARFVDVVLAPGDMLYVPPRWWHYVQSLDRSCSVSFWWG